MEKAIQNGRISLNQGFVIIKSLYTIVEQLLEQILLGSYKNIVRICVNAYRAESGTRIIQLHNLNSPSIRLTCLSTDVECQCYKRGET